MPFQLDPDWLSNTGSTVAVLLVVGYYLRRDIIQRNKEDREERERERLTNREEREATQARHKETITELKDTINNMVNSHQETITKLGSNHQDVANKILSKAEETEKFSERRYEMLLARTLVEKNDPPLTAI